MPVGPAAPGHGAPSAPRGRRAAILSAAAALAIGLLALARDGGPSGFALHNDSYQYLSAAEHLAHEGGALTSLVHFDTERAHGSVPAPLTTFPPGYPAAVAAVAATGLSREWSGVLVSLVATVALAFLIHRAARALDLSPAGEMLALALWALNAQVANFASSVQTEAAFTLVSLGAVVLLLPREREGVRPAVAGALVGAAVWIRYAGLFFALAFNAWGLWRLVRGRRGRRAWAVGLLACDVIAAGALLRNVVLAGTWRGGNTRTALHGLAPLAYDLGAGHGALVLGWGSASRRPLFLVSAALVVVGAAGMAVAWWWASRGRAVPEPIRRGAPLLLLWIAVYEAAMIYAGLTSDVSIGARMFFPLWPLVALAVGAAATVALGATPGAGGRRAAAWLAVFLAGYAGANLDGFLHPKRLSPHLAVAGALAAPGADGVPLRSWLEANVARSDVLLAVDGQATGYLLDRGTVSLVGRQFSDVTWDERSTHAAMERFGARYLVVYAEPPAGPARPAPPDAVLRDSPFLARLAAGRAPGWLELADGSTLAKVYRLR